jgi:hypothetical protein
MKWLKSLSQLYGMPNPQKAVGGDDEVLVTKNPPEYERVTHLKLENWQNP